MPDISRLPSVIDRLRKKKCTTVIHITLARTIGTNITVKYGDPRNSLPTLLPDCPRSSLIGRLHLGGASTFQPSFQSLTLIYLCISLQSAFFCPIRTRRFQLPESWFQAAGLLLDERLKTPFITDIIAYGQPCTQRPPWTVSC